MLPNASAAAFVPRVAPGDSETGSMPNAAAPAFVPNFGNFQPEFVEHVEMGALPNASAQAFVPNAGMPQPEFVEHVEMGALPNASAQAFVPHQVQPQMGDVNAPGTEFMPPNDGQDEDYGQGEYYDDSTEYQEDYYNAGGENDGAAYIDPEGMGEYYDQGITQGGYMDDSFQQQGWMERYSSNCCKDGMGHQSDAVTAIAFDMTDEFVWAGTHESRVTCFAAPEDQMMSR